MFVLVIAPRQNAINMGGFCLAQKRKHKILLMDVLGKDFVMKGATTEKAFLEGLPV